MTSGHKADPAGVEPGMRWTVRSCPDTPAVMR